MDDQRIGAAFRAARIRRGWTQMDLAGRSGVSASLISSLERGQVDTLSVRTLRRIAARLEIWVSLTPRMRAGDLERLLNAGHAALHEELAKYLAGLPGWVHAPEVSFAVYAERGIIDILAFHEPTGSLLVIELKTALVSLEDLLGTMDVRMRLALRVARERGWNARTVSGWVVIADTRTNRRRVVAHRSVLRSAFAADGRQMRAWLRRPAGEVRALSFWTISSGGGASQLPALRRRVRHARGPSQKAANSPAATVRPGRATGETAGTTLIGDRPHYGPGRRNDTSAGAATPRPAQRHAGRRTGFSERRGTPGGAANPLC